MNAQRRNFWPAILACLFLVVVVSTFLVLRATRVSTVEKKAINYQPRQMLDASGLNVALSALPPGGAPLSHEELRDFFANVGQRQMKELDAALAEMTAPTAEKIQMMIYKALMHLYSGESTQAYEVLTNARQLAESSPTLASDWLFTIIFHQGVAGLRRGEDENCLHCLGEGACVFPIRPTAIHDKQAGSRIAIRHFEEYLQHFPDDLGARWLLNVAFMTVGEFPDSVPSKYLIAIDSFGKDADIGRFRDIAPLVGVNRFGQAGGAVMDDFDNDGLLDIAVTNWDSTAKMALFRNSGTGQFEDRTEKARLDKQLGGFNITQTDFNNDGALDLYISRGAWIPNPVAPTLLRNNRDGKFTDVTEESRLGDPVSSNAAAWADFDNDGFLDVFVCNETGQNRLYRNRHDGTFEEVAEQAGVGDAGKFCKGAVWLDFDNDTFPDLFVSNLLGNPVLYHNNANGTFSNVTRERGITGPNGGFTCWSFDYDNDGWLDIFATCYQRDLDSLVADVQGIPGPRSLDTTRLFRNDAGKGFKDVSKEVGVNRVFATMGANYADFDNDGFLDFYLGTGEPSIATLIPNRMFKNIEGKRFADISTTAGVGHLQKGHGIACGDWDRDGNVDLFVQMGGVIPGDSFQSALFQNPGHDNSWITVKLVGKKTNRAAIGARIKLVTAGESPNTIYRHVGFGSSFGGNPLEQTTGLGKAKGISSIEVTWPTSKSTQVFKNVAANQSIEITEFETAVRPLETKQIPLPKP